MARTVGTESVYFEHYTWTYDDHDHIVAETIEKDFGWDGTLDYRFSHEATFDGDGNVVAEIYLGRLRRQRHLRLPHEIYLFIRRRQGGRADVGIG